MKWFQNLPNKWHATRLKNAVELRTDRVVGSAKDRGYIGLENIESWTGQLLLSEPATAISEDDVEKQNNVSVFREGDILFGKLRPYLAKALLTKDNGICSTELLVLKPNKHVNSGFLHRTILTKEFIDQVNSETFGVKMPRAEWDTISSIIIPLPPLPTQRAIAAFLDRETAKIDAKIEAKQRLLELLAERTSLVL